MVLPWLPATAIGAAHGHDRTLRVGTAEDGHTELVRAPNLGVRRRDRGRRDDGVDAIGDVAGIVTDTRVDAECAQALERSGVAQVGAADPVPHPHEHCGERAHDAAAEADDVHRARHGEIEVVLSAAARAASSTRSAKRAVASVRPSDRAASPIDRNRGRVGEQLVELAREARAVELTVGHHDRGVGAREDLARSASDDRPALPASGTKTDGMPTAASSAVIPPDRHTMTVAFA